jgi:ketosteroid isomerase-like protein
MSPDDEVLTAAAELVAAFAAGELDAYFGAFAEDATFLFHTHPELIRSTAGYRAVWDGWVRDAGFRVVGASSTEPQVQWVGPSVAIFTHRVDTTLSTVDGLARLQERETIVFERRNGRWLAVHEHLSPDPQAAADGPGAA